MAISNKHAMRARAAMEPVLTERQFAGYFEYPPLDRSKELTPEPVCGNRDRRDGRGKRFSSIAVYLLRNIVDFRTTSGARCVCCDYRVVVEMISMGLLKYGAEGGFWLPIPGCARIGITEDGLNWLKVHEAPDYSR